MYVEEIQGRYCSSSWGRLEVVSELFLTHTVYKPNINKVCTGADRQSVQNDVQLLPLFTCIL